MLLGAFVVIALLNLFSDEKKGKIATGYWGGASEKNAARKKAKEQMLHPLRNSAALYIGTPADLKQRLQAEWYQQGLIKKPPKESKFNLLKSLSPTLYIPDAQRGIAAIGAAGSGKTFSVIDPLIRSALDQGFPTIIYDFKYPAQTKRSVAYALKRGYSVRVFAPGFPESDVCNPLDLLKNEEDAVAAGQLAQVINRNMDLSGGKDSKDKFFDEAGDTLVEGIFLVTKAVGTLIGDNQYCDLMMAQAILSLPDLAKRLELASREKLKVWTSRPLSQLISVKDSEKTVSGIVGTAQRVFQRFLKKDFVGAFCGKTTLPLDLDGKQLIIFGLDRNNRDIVGPLLAAILHMVITRNVSRTIPRGDSLVVALDELPTLYLPALVNWLNENREDGFCGILGYQNVAQLEKAYGKELTRAIIGGTGSKFIFNPQDPESAKFFAELLGEVEIQFKSKSRSTGKGGGSRSLSEQYQKRYLLEPAQFTKLHTGRAVIINPAYCRGDESYVPLRQKIRVPKADITEQEWSERNWRRIQKILIKKNNSRASDSERSRQFNKRRELAEVLFPLPKEQEGHDTQSTDKSYISETEIGNFY
ncbi:MAG: type IV secretory system conjugative DNA transfer family protein [Symploca sp. SIO1C4]|uniref:Type IV secretory system conjugative DNA transfer family protein n=1 Tax=Symploca sp. SIO1C4 TaxID=2607765 RepID=A0A6B3NJS6_9CYAN|nr:type IV secretory system conjugative DNA transfer family protein [Symploca sp. SIO1C4]